MSSIKDKFAKYEAKDWIMMAVGLTTFIIVLIILFSLTSIETDKIQDDSVKTKVKNSRNSTYVLIFMMILSGIVGVLSPLKCEPAPKAFLRYF